MPNVLLVEDDPAFARRVQKNLELDGFQTEHASDALTALRRLAERRFDAVLCDIRLPGMSGLEFLTRLREGKHPDAEPSTPVVMLTSINTVETAVDAMRRGASDYLTKDAARGEIALRLTRAVENHAVSQENQRLRETVARIDEFGTLVGESSAMARIKDEIAEVAATDATVLILGETGVGKELVARAIHASSGRRGQFVDLNGAMLPDDALLRSELFGHERGAFTDAKEMKRGKLELADGGTLFLDEVGEVSRDVQASLLRVLETLTFTRVGGTKPIKVDVRLVVATNRDLLREVEAGRFREDLYYRLNVFPIVIPPLRERRQDIAPLTRFFLARAAERYGRPVPEPTPDALERLREARWSGNVRELRNISERLLIRARGGTVMTVEDVLACGIGEARGETGRHLALPEEGLNLDDLERDLVLEALRRCDWNQTDAAKLLGISVDRMNNRVKKFGFTHPKWRVNKGSAD